MRPLATPPRVASPTWVAALGFLLVAVLGVSGASPALAASARYASYDGTGSACSMAEPCAARVAVEGAEDGDVVTLLYDAGHDFEICASCVGLRIEHEIVLRGEPGRPRPTITAAASGYWPAAIQVESPGVVVEGVRIVVSDRQALVASTTGVSIGGDPEPGPVDEVTIRDVDIEATDPGSNPAVSTQGDDTLERMRLMRDGSSSGDALWISDGGLVRDSFVIRDQEGGGSAIRTFGSGGIRFRNLTVFGTDIGIFALGGPYELSVRDSIIDGAEIDDLRTASGSTVTVNVDYSNLNPSQVHDEPPESSVNLIAPIQDQTVETPELSNPFAYDFHQLDTSPTVDAGSPDAFTGAFDVDGEPRIMGAGIDIGADELHDEEPPDTVLDAGPAEGAVLDSAAPIFAFSSTAPDALSFECSLDGAGFSACSSPFATAPLSEGPHSFAVRAVDTAGNVDPTPATRRFTVDTTPTGPGSPAPGGGGDSAAPVSGSPPAADQPAEGADRPGGPATRLLLAHGPIRVRRNRAIVRLRCVASEPVPPCSARLVLRTAARLPIGGRRRRLVIGRARASIPTGAWRRVAVRVPARKQRLLRRVRRARRVQVILRGGDGAVDRTWRLVRHRGLKVR